LGKKKVIVGDKSFFLQPNEQLEKGIEDIYILDEDEGVVVKCIESFEDEIAKVIRVPGKIKHFYCPLRWKFFKATDG
jgi:major vault protein